MSQFKNLIFEGGGVKGIAYAGALEVLQDIDGLLPGIERVAGTSAGAITATLLALGASSQDVERIVGGTKFRKFMDDSWGIVRDTTRLVKKFGWFKGDAFSKWMKKQIDTLVENKDLTFAQLKKMADGNPKYKELSMVCSNLTLQKPEVYSAETTPDMRIWEGVRRSMSIPLFFKAVRDSDDDVLVDGGLTWNYPIDLYDRQRYLPSENTASFTRSDLTIGRWPDYAYNKETLGFRVDSTDEIAFYKRHKDMPPLEIDNLPEYIKAILGYMTDMANRSHLTEQDRNRTVFIDSAGIGTTEFDLNDANIKTLTDNGRKAAEEFFAWFDHAPATEAKNKVV